VSFPGLLVTFAMMVLTGTLMASCSYALALILKREDTLASVLNTVATPLLLLSGITLPLTLAPKIIRAMASVNPFAYEVTASRSLFLGNFSDSAIMVGILFLGSLAVLAFVWAARSFRKGTA
jgi:ABC-2 type transport system permease protein